MADLTGGGGGGDLDAHSSDPDAHHSQPTGTQSDSTTVSTASGGGVFDPYDTTTDTNNAQGVATSVEGSMYYSGTDKGTLSQTIYARDSRGNIASTSFNISYGQTVNWTINFGLAHVAEVQVNSEQAGGSQANLDWDFTCKAEITPSHSHGI